jgi:hypothetical protein
MTEGAEQVDALEAGPGGGDAGLLAEKYDERLEAEEAKEGSVMLLRNSNSVMLEMLLLLLLLILRRTIMIMMITQTHITIVR